MYEVGQLMVLLVSEDSQSICKFSFRHVYELELFFDFFVEVCVVGQIVRNKTVLILHYRYLI